MEEIWRDIKGYEGLYQVSNLGRVKSLNYNHTKKEKILTNNKHNTNYLSVTLVKNKVKKQILVHRLVAEAFIPNKYNYPIVNHKNEDKSNNKVDNLEWCTYEYNNNYGTRVVKTTKQVYQYTLDGQLIKKWKSINEIQRILGFKTGGICNCCKCRTNTAYGFKWRYA